MRLTLKQALAYIEDDALVEVTPQSIRLRKRPLDASARRKEAKRGPRLDRISPCANDRAFVIRLRTYQSNGVIHVIDEVMLPS